MILHPMEIAFRYRRDSVPSLADWQRMYDSLTELYQQDYKSQQAVIDANKNTELMRTAIQSTDKSDGYFDKFSLLVNQIRYLITECEIHGYRSQMTIIRESFNNLQSDWWQRSTKDAGRNHDDKARHTSTDRHPRKNG